MSCTAIPLEDRLSTGSTILNLACSGDPDWGLAKGLYFWMCGSSSSGKTFLTLTSLAEAANNRNWDNYELIYDNVEDGALMDVARFFGTKLRDRLLAPRYDKSSGLPIYSYTIEDFYFGLDSRLTEVEKGERPPFLYLLDSMDALTSLYEQSKFKEKKREHDGGPAAKGDYGDGKAKINSTFIRSVVSRLRNTRSTLIVLSQTRDNVGGGLFDPKETNAGGRALKFYAAWQLWSSKGSSIKKDVNGQARQIGINSRVAIKKNRLTGREWTVEIPIYHSYGIDDMGSMITFLVREKAAKSTSRGIEIPALDLKGREATLIKKIEKEGYMLDLKDLVKDTFNDVVARCSLDRNPRYE
jgi:RecA/RadA recombinase